LPEGESLAYKNDLVNFCVQVSGSVTPNYLAGFQAFGKWNVERQEYEKMEGVLGIAPQGASGQVTRSAEGAILS
jgi:hypothetical protein